MIPRIAALALALAGACSCAAATTSPPPCATDWANFSRYREANAALTRDASRVVFMGDSITDAWAKEALFTDHPHFVGRGISGQTTQQMLVRFRADVIDLKPAVVHIMAGTNDVAGNNGPESDTEIEDAIASMVELARTNHIDVVLASIPPAADFPWRPGLEPLPRIRRLNTWLKSYAGRVGVTYVDYWAPLAADDGSLKSSFSSDGVHPNSGGYEAMKPFTLAAVESALKGK
jgi:lysophospholipase L1-like esterase